MNSASFETEDRIAGDASTQADNFNQTGAEPLNGNGFYRFKIGDFQATVVSDGQGPIPVSPIFVMNASEAELAPVLRANFMQPVIQATNNPLVVDTGRERILVDTGFGEKIGPPFGSFPRLQANLGRAGIAPESIDLVVISHGHLDHIGGLVTQIGRAGVSEGSVRLRRYGVELLDRQPFRKRGQQFAAARAIQDGHDWSSSREPAAGRRPIPVREARRRNHQRRALRCYAGTFAVSCLNPVRLGQGAVHAYG